jgi:hypothetical protein
VKNILTYIFKQGNSNRKISQRPNQFQRDGYIAVKRNKV